MPGIDGEKMSKSRGNVINIFDTPTDMFGKAMSMKDSVVRDFFVSATRVPLAVVEEHLTKHPKEAKMALAHELVRMYHGEEAADAAQRNFDQAFSKREVPENVPEVVVGEEGLMEALVSSGIVSSKSDYRRLVSDGAIRTVETDEKITERSLPPYEMTLRIGKHRFVRVVKK
jgi:tyrosyl-tRNA synthetase